MSQPTPYERAYSFTDFSSGSPSSQPPGVQIDAELDAVGETLADVLTNLALIQRDDGVLRNGAVGVDQLNSTALALISGSAFNVAGPWASLTAYSPGDMVSDSGVVYLVMEAHVAGALATDVAAGRLVSVFDAAAVALETKLALATGLGLIGTSTGVDAQTALDAKASKAALLASTGLDTIGEAGGVTAQQALDAVSAVADANAVAVSAIRAIDIRGLVGGDGDITATVLAIVSQGYTLAYLRTGSYTVDPSTEIGNLVIEGDGEGTVIAPTSPSTASYLFECTGTATQIADLNANVSAGATSLTFASDMSAVLSPGDLIHIYNPTDYSHSGYRAEYRAGEFAVVKSVSTVTVNLMEKLVAGYTAAAVDVYKIAPATGGLKNISFDAGGQRLARFRYGRNNKVEGIKGANAAVHGVFFDRCFGFLASKLDLRNFGQASDDYALAVGNCQNGLIERSYLYARRHPVDKGGSNVTGCTPTRFVKTKNCTLVNDIDADVVTADFHGNTEFCEYVECDIAHGAAWGGANNGYTRCNIGNALDGQVIYGTEILRGKFWARDCDITTYLDPSAGSRGIIDASDACLTDNTVGTVFFYVEDNRVYSTALSGSSSFFRWDCENTAGTVKVNAKITGNTFDVNALGFVLYTDKTGVGSVDSDWIIVDGVAGAPSGTYLALHNGSHFLNFPHRLQKQTGSLDAATPNPAARSYVSSAQVYGLAYPRIPNGQVTLAPQSTGALSGVLGGVAGTVAVPYFNQKTATQAALAMTGNNNWGTDVAFALDWAVWLDEVI